MNVLEVLFILTVSVSGSLHLFNYISLLNIPLQETNPLPSLIDLFYSLKEKLRFLCPNLSLCKNKKIQSVDQNFTRVTLTSFLTWVLWRVCMNVSKTKNVSNSLNSSLGKTTG